MKTAFVPCIVLALGFAWPFEGDANTHVWREAEGGVRWADLTVPTQGKVGFILLPPEQTGLFFTNVLEEWASAANRVLENGSGTAIGDFDNDGKPDLFLCSLQGRNALYRNLGEWKFKEVTRAAGLHATNHVCRGAVFADINGDSWLDLLISTLNHGVRCFLNEGGGRFTDATERAGTETRFGSTTLALADIDGNGTLDLYVATYRTDDIRDRSRVEVQMVNGRMVLPPKYQDRLILTGSGLMEYGEPDVLYLNNGQGQFRAVAGTGGAFLDEAGQPLGREPADWGLTAAFRDLNEDGFPDLYVCNDYWTPDRVWINDGRGRFRAIAPQAIRHTSENSMGVDFADIDRDGHLDFMIPDMVSRDPALRRRQVLAQTRIRSSMGNFDDRPQVMRNCLFHNRGDGTFAEIADYSGVAASDWSWQPVFVDVDLDGYEDLIIPAGHTRDVQDLDATMKIKALQHPWPKDMDPIARQEAFTREMMHNVRLYPTLQLAIFAFRNLGNLRFEDVTPLWGTTAPGVHQGIALGDLDQDGDLDFVVNNLNGVCGVYRNDGTAPRVAVALKGSPPNTQGIGARVRFRGGAVPTQSQEVVCGGRYLSGFDPMLVFASGKSAGNMSIEVLWRSGKTSLVTNVIPDRIYVVSETGARSQDPATSQPDKKRAAPLFEDVSGQLNHLHTENDYDDFARQPLLSKRLSRLGPGAAWYDLDQDGHDDLILGSGAGGRLGVYHNDGQGGFQRVTGIPVSASVPRDQTGVVALHMANQRPVVLTGMANYEDGQVSDASVRQYDLARNIVDEDLPGALSSTGPLAVADIEGDGDLDLFVGGRVVPGRYPEPASSRIFRMHNGAWQFDEHNSLLLERIGLVSGAVWSDLDGDGFPELILACEWGPIRVFKNEAGNLTPWDVPLIGSSSRQPAQSPTSNSPLTTRNSPLTTRNSPLSVLSSLTGWWSGVTTGDLDGDGKLDIVVGNWGLNSPYQATPEHPLQLYCGDFLGRGMVDLIETEHDPLRDRVAPRHRLDYMVAGLPLLRERFATHQVFSEATVDELLRNLRTSTSVLQARTLASMVFFNRGTQFEAVELPPEAQFAPAFSVHVMDFDGDGYEDVFLTQNFFALRWELHRLDAGRGLLLGGAASGMLHPVPGQDSGIQVYGEQRGAAAGDFNEDGRVDLVVTQNGADTKLYLNTAAKPGLRVRLAGPPANPTGVGATIRLKFADRFGPAREVHAGSGYGSQDSAVQVMATPTAPSHVQVAWPGGKVGTRPVPPNAREISVDPDGNIRVKRPDFQ